jgi:hypothetical protein
MNWWPGEFLNGNNKDLPGNYDLVAQMNRRVGYRLQIVRASWPTRIKSGSIPTVKLLLRNAGVAPCFGGGHAALSLVDSSGQLRVETLDKEFDVADLAVGPSVEQAPAITRNISLRIPSGLDAGTYNVCVSIRNGRGPYRLPITEWFDEHGRYLLGSITIM